VSSSRQVAITSLCLALFGCADWSRGVAGPDAGETTSDAPSDGSAAFATAVHPLLAAGCRTCHAADGEASGTAFVLTGMVATDHATTLPFVDLGAPVSSRLLVKMSGAGHGGGAVFANGSPEFGMVLRWIREGALP
jgi:hypothetical protein